ncbi:MAG: alpha/beta hydrolase [Chitinophagaceae bacterium]|nr:alpha/beta hydrolase [Chitinophagaceae bacterium]
MKGMTGTRVLKNYFVYLFLITVVFMSCVKEPLPGGGGTGGGGGTNPLPERIIMDTAFGTDPKQKMDIYLPAGRSNATKLIVLIHGGAWEAGDKADMNYYKNILRLKWPEAAIANINYRLASNTGNIHHTEIMNDIKAAVNMLVSNKTHFVVSDTLTMVGASAGAHLAMLYTYAHNTNNYVKAVADFYGPAKLSDWSWYSSYNIFLGKPISEILIKYNGSPWDVPLYDSNSPHVVATAQSKPTIIFHGTLDVIVPLYQSQQFRARLNTLGVLNEYYEYFDGHGFNSGNTDDAMNKAVAF